MNYPIFILDIFHHHEPCREDYDSYPAYQTDYIIERHYLQEGILRRFGKPEQATLVREVFEKYSDFGFSELVLQSLKALEWKEWENTPPEFYLTVEIYPGEWKICHAKTREEHKSSSFNSNAKGSDTMSALLHSYIISKQLEVPLVVMPLRLPMEIHTF